VSPGEHGELVADVLGWMRGRAAAYKVPTTVRVIAPADLPLTATGKVSKKLLQEQAQRSLSDA
jgi:fatty-acyl-CoA synthase